MFQPFFWTAFQPLVRFNPLGSWENLDFVFLLPVSFSSPRGLHFRLLLELRNFSGSSLLFTASQGLSDIRSLHLHLYISRLDSCNILRGLPAPRFSRCQRILQAATRVIFLKVKCLFVFFFGEKTSIISRFLQEKALKLSAPHRALHLGPKPIPRPRRLSLHLLTQNYRWMEIFCCLDCNIRSCKSLPFHVSSSSNAIFPPIPNHFLTRLLSLLSI